jgi:phage terminase small subunit
MGYDIQSIESEAVSLLEARPEGLNQHDKALLSILLDNLRMVSVFDDAINRDGPLVKLPNSIVTAHPALRPRDNSIRRAVMISKELGLISTKPVAKTDSALANFLKGPYGAST